MTEVRPIRLICAECAQSRGCYIPMRQMATWHTNRCDVCNETKSVTEPRDFRPRPDRSE